MLRSHLVLLLLAIPAPAQELAGDGPWGFPGWWTDNLRWSFDESVRPLVNEDGDVGTLAFFGLDLHKVVSTSSRDLATLTLQPYLTRIDVVGAAPPLFDGPEDWELVWRIFNANLKLRQDGSLNVRAGHFELPFGLEQTLNTNGTLRDYTHVVNFGIKGDWGATLNGDLESFEYELAWSRGSGNEYRDEGGDGVLSGRFGTSRDEELAVGLSFADGDFRSPGGLVERRRGALDVMLHHRAYGFFGELIVGQDAGDVDVLRGLAEVNWRNPHETVLAWWQLTAAELDGPTSDTTTADSLLGVRWTPANGWTASVQYRQVLDAAADDQSREASLALQLRYRF